MGPVVVAVVVLLLLLFKTLAQDLLSKVNGVYSRLEGRDPTSKEVLYAKPVPMSDMSRLSSGLDPRDPTPKKVLYAMSAPMSDRSWQGLKTFFRVGSPNLKGSNPEESFICEVSTYV